LLPRQNDPDTGIGSFAADALSLVAGGVEGIRVTESGGEIAIAFGDDFTLDDSPNAEFQAVSFGGPAIRNRPTAGTIPVLCPNKGDLDTGLGGGADDAVSLVSGGVEALQLRELNSAIIQIPQADKTITAFAGGGQGNVLLKSSYNILTVVATAGDAVTLPAIHQVNSLIFIKNNGAEAADVFPDTGDDLGLGTNIAFSLPAGESVSFIGTVQNTTWTQWDVSAVPAATGVVQTSITEDGEVATGTTIMPIDDTIPQITEGDEYMTLSHTPLDAANLLNITVGVYLENPSASRMSVAVFQDAVANALGAVSQRGDDGDPHWMYFRTQIVAGGTSAITFRVRAGASASGTTTFNGIGGSRIFGGVMASNIYIEEVTP
jgi:hypothetical protein